MRLSRLAAPGCALLAALALAACGGSQGGCAAHVPIGPVPAGTPIPVQPLPANSGLTANATVTVEFTIDASGTVTAERVLVGSGSAVVDAKALDIVRTTPFRSVDTNCQGAPVRQGFVTMTFSPNA